MSETANVGCASKRRARSPICLKVSGTTVCSAMTALTTHGAMMIPIYIYAYWSQVRGSKTFGDDHHRRGRGERHTEG